MLFGVPVLTKKIPNVPTERSLLRYGTKCNQAVRGMGNETYDT
jgi:hypothetical protein